MNDLSNSTKEQILLFINKIKLARIELILADPHIYPPELWQLMVEYSTYDSRAALSLIDLIFSKQLLNEPITFLSDDPRVTELKTTELSINHGPQATGLRLVGSLPYMNTEGLIPCLYIYMIGTKRGDQFYRWGCYGINMFKAVFESDRMRYWQWEGDYGLDPSNEYMMCMMPGMLNLLYARMYSCLDSPDPLFAQFARYRAR